MAHCYLVIVVPRTNKKIQDANEMEPTEKVSDDTKDGKFMFTDLCLE